MKVYHTSKKQNWGTPQALFDTIHDAYAFTLDAAADRLSAKCPIYFDEATNGLALDWFGTVWLNPPYDNTAAWVDKAIREVQQKHCDCVAMLVAARPDTAWWWQAMRYAGIVSFLKGRLKFEMYKEVFAGDEKSQAPGVLIVDKGPCVVEITTGESAPFPSAVLTFRREPSPKQYIQWVDWKKTAVNEFVGFADAHALDPDAVAFETMSKWLQGGELKLGGVFGG